MKKLIVIAGPTAVGKTAIAIALAKRLNTSVLSADSRQCYREMNIGTAKPSPAERKEVTHYFIDAFPVTVNISAADYEKLALGYLEEIFAGHDIAIACGGTGLYIRALCEGLDGMPPTDAAIEQEVNRDYAAKGLEWLRQRIEKEDPAFYARGEVQNPARLIRALAFVRSTGESILAFRTGKKKKREFSITKIGLELPRAVLYDRIDRRVEDMMRQGLLQEAESLYPLRHLKNLQTVGYRELFDYMDGRYSLAAAVGKIKQHTRNYAKRQLTWFKKDREFIWMDAGTDRVAEIVQLSRQD